MKLHYRTLLVLLLTALPVALVGVWLLYRAIHAQILHEVDEQLTSDFLQVQRQLSQGAPGAAGFAPDPHLKISPTAQRLEPTFSDTTEYDLRERQPGAVRQLTASVGTPQGTFRVVLKQPITEFESIAGRVSRSVIICFLGLLLLLVGADWLLHRRLWKPFYRILDELRNYRLDAATSEPFEASSVLEFNQLSRALNVMTRNLNGQFLAQRQFIENASHETQTPLAIASADVEQLMQSERLAGHELQHLERIQDSLHRLSRLNKSLLLLSKIDNQQFTDSRPVDLSALLAGLTPIYADFARHKNLDWQTDMAPNVSLTLNPYLADVLLTNLVRNAIQHCPEGGTVRLRLTPEGFETENSGPPLPFARARLFERFVKNPAQTESTGLGLAIVADIAALYGMKPGYAYDEAHQRHQFWVWFTIS